MRNGGAVLGRYQENAAVAAAFESGAVLVVIGEPGIGKSALLGVHSNALATALGMITGETPTCSEDRREARRLGVSAGGVRGPDSGGGLGEAETTALLELVANGLLSTPTGTGSRRR